MLHQTAIMAGQSVNRFKKRERTQNWAYEEKKFLLELCKKDMSIIESKRLDSDLIALKNRAWRLIHHEFTKAFGSERNCIRLKEQWRRMKACTRVEIMDYHHRLARFGQEVADRKRPNPFTFEIWDFMQDAKKLCRLEALQDIDYSKVQLTLEEGVPETDIKIEDSDHDVDDEEDDDDNWETTTQNMCEVEMKETSPDDSTSSKRPKLSATLPFGTKEIAAMMLSNGASGLKNDPIMPSLSINNMAASLDTLKLLKQGTNLFGTSKLSPNGISSNGVNGNGNGIGCDRLSDESKELLDMHAKEHALRMEILEIQLQTAKFNRDVAEINKMVALKSLTSSSHEQNRNGDH